MKALHTTIQAVESLIIMVVPIYLWGWLIGLLVFSGLSSLLHIVWILEHKENK